MRNIIAISIALLLTACGKQTPTNSNLDIVGGSSVTASDRISKITVSLIKSGTTKTFCTGTLIDRNFVLTAAHCLKDLPFEPAVGLGIDAASAKIVQTSGVIAHRDYDEYGSRHTVSDGPINDIGLVALKDALPEIDHLPEVLSLSSDLTVGEDFVLAGFGITSAETEEGSGVLRTVTTKIRELSETQKEIHFGGAAGKSACSGDSGGPAFVKRDGNLVLAGVTSRGSPDCDEEGTYTDVRYFKDWISESKQALTRK
jgi:secreted trypsin-like serine protease